MKEFVIDASAALSWLAPTQATASSAVFLQTRRESRLVAPHIFNWEVGNTLIGLQRRRLLSAAALEQAFVDLRAFDVFVALPMSPSEIEDLALIAREWSLSLFDSAYLQLALERDFALVSRDSQLLTVAGSEGLECVDLREAA